MSEVIKQLIKENDEVFYLPENSTGINAQYWRFLSLQSAQNQRKRCRICTHKSADETLHEMFIMHRKGNYVPPHAHSNSDESLTLLKGEGAMFFYDQHGKLLQIIYLNADNNKGASYVRTPKNVFHSLFIISEEFLFKEVVLGPFQRSNMVEANFAPKENQPIEINDFLINCQQQLKQVMNHDG